MNNQDVGLDQLFASARSQAPEYGFEETKKQFLGSVVLAAGGVLATKGIISLFTKKWIIMMTIATMATSAAVVVSTYSFTENEPPVEETIPAITEELQEDKEEPVEEETLIVEMEEVGEPTEIPDLTPEEVKEILLDQGMIDETQDVVNGKVRVKLYKGNVVVVGRQSEDSLFDEKIATFEDDAGAYDQKDAEGFIKLNALRLRIAANKGRDQG